MSLLPTNLDYTDRDFDSLRLRLQRLTQSVFPTWTDYNTANFGNILIELMAFVGDVLGFYQDKQANESRIATATQRKSLIALAKMLSFVPTNNIAAQAIETFALGSSPVGSVTIPAGTRVYTSDVTSPVYFQLLAPVVFQAGTQTLTQTALVENSETVTDVFTSNNLANQSYVLSAQPYVDQSAIVVANDGAYEQIDNFLDSLPTSKQFTVSVDQNAIATITFGNGTNGTIPVGTINVTSKQGGGATGNVELGTINRIEGSFTDAFGASVNVAVTNAAPSAGGREQQSNAEIKSQAPAQVGATKRTVARGDFEVNAKRVAGVARALMTTNNEDASVPENTGILYIVPTSGGLPSSALKAAVLAQFVSSDPTVTPPYASTLTFQVLVQDPSYLTINVYAAIYPRVGTSAAQAALNVRATLRNFFALYVNAGTSNEADNPSITFGLYYTNSDGSPSGGIALSDVFDAVAETAGVRKVGGRPSDFLLNGVHGDVPVTTRQFPQLGSVTLVDGETGATL